MKKVDEKKMFHNAILVPKEFSGSDNICNWVASSSLLSSGRTPDVNLLIDEIMQHDEPMPQILRDFLADFLRKHLKNDIGEGTFDELPSHQRSRIRKHEALFHYRSLQQSAEFEGKKDPTWQELKEKLAKKFDVDEDTIDSDIYQRKNKPKY